MQGTLEGGLFKTNMDVKSEHVLVGVCDQKISASYETSWQCNKLGGYPDWMSPNCEYPSCNVCGDPTQMYQVAQVYCPLESSSCHRTIYAFACVKKTCLNNSKSWRVFRCQLPSTSPPLEGARPATHNHQNVVSMATDGWCEDADDWGSDSEIEGARDNFSSTLATKPNKKEDGEESISAPSQPPNEKQACIHENPVAQSNCSFNSSSTAMQHPLDETCMPDKGKVENVNFAKHTELDVTFGNCNISEEINSKSSSQDVLPMDEMNDLSLSTPMSDEISLEGRTGNDLVASRPPKFEAYFLNVFDEPVSSATSELTNHERELMLEYQQREGVDFLELQDQNFDHKRFSSGACVETYEKTNARHGDEIFAKFAKRLRFCPEQCIRYCWNGHPLYMTSPHEGSITPSCSYCGGPRIFELQFMPALIKVLHDPNRPDAAVDFGTVIIYTCRDSCWSNAVQPGQPALREEHAVFQLDSDSLAIAQASSVLIPKNT